MTAPMHVCYVLACDGWSRHAQMTFISASAVRRVHPDARISLVADPATFSALERPGRRLLDLVDGCVTVDTTLQDNLEISRYLKTVVRARVDGDVVYLDGDTLPVAPFDGIMSGNAAVGAVLDLHGRYPAPLPPSAFECLYGELGWPFRTRGYYNSGVLVLKSRPDAYRLCDEWHRKWLRSREAGVPLDQPALNSAIEACGTDLDVLPAEYNLQVCVRPRGVADARILHFFGSIGDVDGSILNYLLEEFARSGHVDWRALDQSVAEDHPWQPNPEPWQLRRSGHPFKAAMAKISRLAGRAPRWRLRRRHT